MQFLAAFTFLASISATAAPSLVPFTYEELVETIQTNSITSIEALLPHIPEENRANFTLMHTSRSIQPASASAPRVILYGPDASLIMAYSGDEKLNPAAFQRLELIQYRPDQRAFEMREIDFSKGRAEFSLPNLPRCLGCHRADPRPNWEHYNTWPGAYGEDDDRLSDSEGLMVEKFLPNALQLPRYSALVGLEAGFALDSYGSRARVPRNIKFTQRMFQLNFKRVARLFMSTPDYSKYKYLIALTIGCTAPLDRGQYIPKAVTESFLKKHGPIPESYYDRFAHYDLAFFRYLFEPRDISVDDWFTNFMPDINTSFTTPGSGGQELLGHLVEADRELEEFVDLGESRYHEVRAPKADISPFNCNVLAEKSKAALSK